MRDHLSSKHHTMEGNCTRCHTPWMGVKSESCLECHKKKTGHIKAERRLDEQECATCHKEHGGEEKNLAYAPDKACIGCHESSLSLGEWEHKREMASGRNGVLMTHKTHFDRGTYKEKICLGCHYNDTLRMNFTIVRHTKDVMLDHTGKKGQKCDECHLPVKQSGFTATGGGHDPSLCVACHNKKLVSVKCVYCHIYHSWVMPERAPIKPPPVKNKKSK